MTSTLPHAQIPPWGGACQGGDRVTHGLLPYSQCSVAPPLSPTCLFLKPIRLSLALVALKVTITALIWDVGWLSFFASGHISRLSCLESEQTHISSDTTITCVDSEPHRRFEFRKKKKRRKKEYQSMTRCRLILAYFIAHSRFNHVLIIKTCKTYKKDTLKFHVSFLYKSSLDINWQLVYDMIFLIMWAIAAESNEASILAPSQVNLHLRSIPLVLLNGANHIYIPLNRNKNVLMKQ